MKNKANALAGGLSQLSKSAAKNRDAVSATIVLISPLDCYVKENPRTEFNNALITQLAREFVDPEVGQKEAIHVYPKDDSGKYRIHHGGTRFLASELALETKPDFKLRAVVDHLLLEKDDLENWWDQGSNNILRDNMSLRDRAEFIGSYLDRAKASGRPVTQTEIAQRLGFKNSSMVSRLLKLRGMTPELAAIYESGKTEDIEALATLAEIQKENPALFLQLAEHSELDRSTIRKAKKAGTLDTGTNSEGSSQEPDEKETPEVRDNFAHAQNSQQQNSKTDSDADADDVYVVPFVDYLFKTGRVNLVIKASETGFCGALETIFDHGINESSCFDSAPIWATEGEAVQYAKSIITQWAEKVAAAKDELKLEELQDVNGYLNSLSGSGNVEDDNEDHPKTTQPQTRQRKNPVKQLTLFGLVDGEECIVLTQVTNEVLAENGDTAGFVFIQVGGEIKIAKIEDIQITGASYRA